MSGKRCPEIRLFIPRDAQKSHSACFFVRVWQLLHIWWLSIDRAKWNAGFETAVAVALSWLDQTFSSLPLVADYERSALTEVVERSLLSLLLVPLIGLVFLLVWKVSWTSTTLGAKLLSFSVMISAFYCQEIWVCSVEFMTAGGDLLSSPPVQRRLLLVWVAEILGQNQFLASMQVRSRRSEEDLERNPGEDGLFTGTEGTVPPLHPDISEKWVVSSPSVELWTEFYSETRKE